MFRAFSPKPLPEVEQVEVQVDRPEGGVEAEHARLVERLAQLQDAIRVLDASPKNRTARAMVERYRANERRLTADCHRLERELARGSQQGELALPY
jgi:hypothetical protein